MILCFCPHHHSDRVKLPVFIFIHRWIHLNGSLFKADGTFNKGAVHKTKFKWIAITIQCCSKTHNIYGQLTTHRTGLHSTKDWQEIVCVYEYVGWINHGRNYHLLDFVKLLQACTKRLYLLNTFYRLKINSI